VPATGSSPERRSALKQFLNWSLQTGQGVARDLGYVSLPGRIVEKAEATVGALQ
jgi:hypothetical protein